MEFIKQMKKREFIEMGLKTLAALLAAFLAIILMEGMIYSINLHALKTKYDSSIATSDSTVAYCIKQGKDEYLVIYKYTPDEKDEKTVIWSSTGEIITEAECKAMEGSKVEKVFMHAPNAFEFSITPVHYVVMTIFVLAVAGFFVYKFIALAKEYNKIEENYKKTGTIELG